MGLLQRSDVARWWFSLFAPEYASFGSAVFWPESVQREWIDRLGIESGDCVLDIGCGTGGTIEHLSPASTEIHGLDQSVDQLKSAERVEELSTVDFLRANAHWLPYSDETFDCVVSVGSILYWADTEEVLREAFRVTKPGGRILVIGFNRRPMSLWNPIHNVQTATNEMLFFQYDADEATRLFREVGWQDVEHGITGPGWSANLIIATIACKKS